MRAAAVAPEGQECRGCGKFIPATGLRGRPQVWCHDPCKGSYSRLRFPPRASRPGTEEQDFTDSLIKKAMRTQILGYFCGRHKNAKLPYHVLTLPGTGVLDRTDSLEQMLLALYPNAKFDFLEKRRENAANIQVEIEDSPIWSKPLRCELLRENTWSYFHQYLDLPTYDLIFLDWMGGMGRDEENTLRAILKDGHLHKDGVLAFTINADARGQPKLRNTVGIESYSHCDPQSLTYPLKKFMLDMGEEYGFLFSPNSPVNPYSCYDINTKKDTMLLAIMIGKGQQSYNAYE